MTDDERDGGTTGDPGAPTTPGAIDLDDAAFDTPACPSCVRRMEPASTSSGGVYWTCVHCGQTRLS